MNEKNIYYKPSKKAWLIFKIIKRPLGTKEIKLKGKLAFFNEDYAEIRAQIENKNYDSILKRPREVRFDQAVFGYVKIYKSKGKNSGYISIWNQSVKKNKDLYTERDIIQKQIVPPIMVGKEMADKIEERLKNFRP